MSRRVSTSSNSGIPCGYVVKELQMYTAFVAYNAINKRNSLNNKQGDIRKIMSNEVRRAEDDLRKTSNGQKNENLKLTQ